MKIKINRRTLQKDKSTDLNECWLGKTKIVEEVMVIILSPNDLGQPYGLMLQFEKFHNLYPINSLHA